MIVFKDVFFQYESGMAKGGLNNINLSIAKGEVILLCGESGCGKTTLIRLINGLIPHYFNGELSGEVTVCGKDIKKTPLHETAKMIGSVFQNPRSQFFNVDTNSELAFGCENMGFPVPDILDRIENTKIHLKLDNLMNRSIFQLSGGEKQKIACGCVHTASPEIIVLDEPSSNLDAQATRDLAGIIAHWKNEGKTIIIAEHRLYYLSDLADRVIYMAGGKIAKDMTMQQAKALSPFEMSDLGLRALALSKIQTTQKAEEIYDEQILLSGFHFTYKNGLHALNIDALTIPKGQIIAVIGRNGAGKSTFARCFCGLNRKFKGKVNLSSKIISKKASLKNAYMVMQDVNHQLFTESVLDEVLLGMKVDEEERAKQILEALNLLQFKDIHPMSLSGGQKQRVAIAGAIASEQEIIIFDEPTSGLDLHHMEQVSECMKALKNMGKTVIIISHDLELLIKTCDHVLHLESGKVLDNYALSGNTARLLSFFAKFDFENNTSFF